MGMSKEEFVERMIRNEYGKKRTKLNRAIREGKRKECNGDAYCFRVEGRIKNTKNMPKSKYKKY